MTDSAARFEFAIEDWMPILLEVRALVIIGEEDVSSAYARLRVYQPEGEHAEWFDQVVIVGPEGTRVTLPIAYNDPTGVWTIPAIDLYTDEVAKVGVGVR